jgi:3-oxoacyl-[acyl-carrier-protein] synthase-3
MLTKSLAICGTKIAGFGVYLPEEVRENDFWPRDLVKKWQRHAGVLEGIQQFASRAGTTVHPLLVEALAGLKDDPFQGYKRRRVAPPEMMPSEMERRAVEEAVRDAQIEPEDVDMLMTFSLPPDWNSYPTAFKLQHECGFKNALAYSLSCNCFSMMVMMDVAHRFISTGQAKNIVAVVSTKYSDAMDFTSSFSVMSGDGAAAIVLQPCDVDKGIVATYQRTDAKFFDAIIPVQRPPAFASPQDYHYGSSNGNHRVFLSANRSAAELITRLPYYAEEACTAALQEANLKAEEIDLLVTNAATVWYSEIIAKLLGIDFEKVEDHILEHGNMGAVNFGMNLYFAQKSGRLQSGRKVLFFGHGGGTGYGALVFVCP